MRPKQHETRGSGDLFRARLDQIINMRHELAQLAGKIESLWLARNQSGASVFLRASRGVSRARVARRRRGVGRRW
jgi:hypothetical protein